MLRKTQPRQSTNIKVDITFEYSRGLDESGSSTYEGISTPEEFLANYQNLCEDKMNFVDRKSSCFPAPSYSIKLVGKMNGNNFEKKFSDIDTYHAFLLRHKLLANTPARVIKI